jgi:hypothetical protein
VSDGLAALLILHITAGAFGLASGAAALIVRKGDRLHRAAGNSFFVAMMIMAASGVGLAVFVPAAASLNSIVGAVTFYLATTSWVTVLRPERESGGFERVVLVFALIVGGLALFFALAATNSPKGLYDGIPAAAYYPFAAIAALGAATDISVIARGGVAGAQRIARHLWRMCTALLVGAFAFFIGQASFLPAWFRAAKLHFVPPLLVLALMLFWLALVFLTRRFKAAPSA